ncbi:hypothetical protein BTW28_15895 [Citrobacter freundii]|uniref:hypothetical protein n=1 Tax=Citrobacter europaeus TaxID=1914243 RepID=UPI0009474AF9|nr:hypothetical protein BTW28_15895 [Citrobacter freundii]HAU5678142.1 hypothetical protein [Citrobacter freundii]
MRKIQKLISAEREEFTPYSSLSVGIATGCGRDEIADAHILMKQFKSELVTIPEWDGDTEDDIWRAIQLLRTILEQIQIGP